MRIKIIYKKTQELKPYKNNPRKNDEAVKFVANSIKEFGFRIPITIDKNDEIVAGETRHKAAKLLKLEEVPCILADDLTEEQIRAFRLADNKVSEKSEWDFELLQSELDLIDMNMVDFGFEDVEKINFDDVEDLEEENYDEPTKEMLCCPNCGHVDISIHFKKV